MKHTLTPEQTENLRGFEGRTSMVSYAGPLGRKSIVTVFRSPYHGWYEVESMGHVVLQTASFDTAVEKYNSL